MAKGSSALEFQYDTLGGIGNSVTELANGTAHGSMGKENGTEEVFISLLDVVDDSGDGTLKPEKLGDDRHPAAVPPQPVDHSATEAPASEPKQLPWSRASKQIRSPTLRLHHEIVEFCRFLEPTLEEDEARREALLRITEIVCSMFPAAEVKTFGSYVTGLYLPTSDMDLVVINSGCTDIPRALRAIGNILVENQMAKNIQVIASASVPIIKFDDTGTGLAFDISFDVANGPKTAKLVTDLMSSLPPMRHLIRVLKLFLQQREMNEVYQGGIGSYALLVMVASFLLQHPSRMPTSSDNNPPLEGNMGLLLLDFFRLYGRTLKCEDVAISCRNGGAYFKKRDNQRFLQRGERQCFLAIEDPQDPTNDLARGSYNIQRVQKAFDFAYRQLSSPIDPDDSSLERIIRLDAVLLSRVPTDRKADLSQPLASFSGRSSKAGGGVNGRNPIKEYSSSEEESDEAAELLDRYDIEARQLEAAEVAKAARQSQQAEKQASKRRRDRRGLEGQGGGFGARKRRLREREREFGDLERQPPSHKKHRGRRS